MVNVQTISPEDYTRWNSYVHSHPGGSAYHLCEWREIISKSYGHKSHFLAAERPQAEQHPNGESTICGMLPLVHMKHPVFGNTLVSMPFLDHAGILADDSAAENALLQAALDLARQVKARRIELRQAFPLLGLQSAPPTSSGNSGEAFAFHSHKHRMLLDLPPTSELLMKSFKSKLRSQIRKPIKEGLTATVGGVEILDDFYHVWSTNMRDLGSPAHSLALFRNVLHSLSPNAWICVVYQDQTPLAASFMIRFGGQMVNPWASSLREYAHLSPNMLLYWTMLQHACECGCSTFDFGRSSFDAGTYRFKEQWGAKPHPLSWTTFSPDGAILHLNGDEKSKFSLAIHLWQKLPVGVTRVIGPPIRRFISL